MSVVSPKFTNDLFIKKMINGIVAIYIDGFPTPWTGTIVGTKYGQTIIFTAAHCLKIPDMSVETVAQKIRVRFNGDPVKYVAQICYCLMNSEILFLRIQRNTSSLYQFRSAPKEQQKLRRYQPIATYAHPHGSLYLSCDGTICSEEFTNPDLGYDEEMIFFNHRMDLSSGCSRASIFNENGYIVGLQSGMYADTVRVMGPAPFDAKEAWITKDSEMRQSTMHPESVELAREKQYLDHALASVRAQFSEGSFGRGDMIPLKLPLSNMKIAVHVKYIDTVLRTQLFFDNVKPLETLITEEKFISMAGSSHTR